MTNRTTKRALLSSVMALLLCFTMLLGTTFAWFTDSAVSANNKITAGTLDVELYQWTDATTATAISESKAPVFDANILWEPGYTSVVYLSIKNNGSLALKYTVAIEVTQVSDHNLAEVMEYAVTPDAKYGDVTSWAGNGSKIENAPGTNKTGYADIELAPGAEHFFALSIHMLEEAGNEYMADSITFDIRVLAGQLTYEEDSFDNTYDEFAGYPGKGSSAVVAGQATTVEVTGDDGYKVGSALIPAAAADENATKIDVEIEKTSHKANITVGADSETIAYDVTVTGLKEGNTTPVKVSLKIPAGKDPDTVKLYHYDTEIDCTYNPTTGYVTFESATFSPFTVVYNAESEYDAPAADGVARPTATVTYASQYVNTKLDWEEGYGQWSPTEGLTTNLEAAFVFECPETLPEEVREVYEYWYCDFYVSLDRALGENQIFLGGNYGDFGWIGFHNGELTLEANEEIGLLESVTTNPWTYADIEEYVGTFICGVGDVDDALNGATFTVKLRLTNPENEAEFYDVNVVTHTFGAGSVIDGNEVVLSNDVDLNDPESSDWLNGLFGNN